MARLPLLGTLALALACGDDGSDDTAAGTTAVSTSDTSTATSEASEAEVTGPPAECDAITCGEGELCVVPNDCSAEAPYCVPIEMVLCDFGTATCTLPDVCSGPAQPGALDCETCL